MRILQIISIAKFTDSRRPGGVYGAEHSTISLCRGLAERGHHVSLVCRAGAPLISVAEEQGGGTMFGLMPTAIGNPRDPKAIYRIIELIRQHQADLVVGQDPRASRLALIAGRLLNVPAVATVRGLYKAKGYTTSRCLIAVSDGVKEHLLAQGVKEARISVVHNGIDLRRFTPTSDMAKAKTQVGLDAHKLCIGVVGRLNAEKGHEWFLNAATRVAREIPSLQLLIVGDGTLRTSLQEVAERVGVGSLTHWAGYQRDVVPWMAAMDILVLPAIAKEGFGRVMVEAGALGKPVMTSEVGGADEVVAHGKSGLIVKTGDVEGLARALIGLLRDAETRHQMGRCGEERARTLFALPRMVEATERVYREALA